MTTVRVFFKISLILSTIFFFTCISLPNPRQLIPVEKTVSGRDKDKILVIPIEGIISDDSREGSFLTGEKDSVLAAVKLQLHYAMEDSNVKAVILKINSPGGTVTASDIIYREVLEFKKKKRIPVLALFMDTAASGAYYISMSSDYLMAHPTTVTGSIGVIMQGINVKEGLDKLGIKDQSIRSGENKAVGSPLEELTAEQRKLLQSVVDNLFDRFFDVVKIGRPKVKESDLKKLADGRIFTASQAIRHGLIDSIGYFEDAVATATRLPGYVMTPGNTNPRVVFYSYSKEKPETVYHIQGVSAENPTLLERVGFGASKVRFLYLFAP
ncbi:signal peptide peptidase SppA, 36K type [Leptospira broomii serovar Hurstbridge str. 5399]|uniref:Signal peptide peptidase SppA, 36K type n=1 Tax=Leptospira broomii serovar Hurstbridge str. 5399 TaxID=1049789 RepID=T0F842_9LEPT|nr:signal peptide peptidase SppA, 36K type [Leptospira broomii serovar Hurstbridge str. 5399]